MSTPRGADGESRALNRARGYFAVNDPRSVAVLSDR